MRRPISARDIVLWIALAPVLGGCHHRNPEATDGASPASAPVPGAVPAAAPPAATVPSFRDEVLPVLVRNCATAIGCHGEEPTESVSLDLRPANAYAQLVNIAAQARPGGLRVRPGDDDQSFLVAKLTGNLVGPEGKPMPIDPGSGVPLIPSPLPPDFVDGVLRPWIRSGAPNN